MSERFFFHKKVSLTRVPLTSGALGEHKAVKTDVSDYPNSGNIDLEEKKFWYSDRHTRIIHNEWAFWNNFAYLLQGETKKNAFSIIHFMQIVFHQLPKLVLCVSNEVNIWPINVSSLFPFEIFHYALNHTS